MLTLKIMGAVTVFVLFFTAQELLFMGAYEIDEWIDCHCNKAVKTIIVIVVLSLVLAGLVTGLNTLTPSL
jgi:hypothetical protein